LIYCPYIIYVISGLKFGYCMVRSQNYESGYCMVRSQNYESDNQDIMIYDIQQI
jgi:hypothetical protein